MNGPHTPVNYPTNDYGYMDSLLNMYSRQADRTARQQHFRAEKRYMEADLIDREGFMR